MLQFFLAGLLHTHTVHRSLKLKFSYYTVSELEGAIAGLPQDVLFKYMFWVISAHFEFY